MEDVVLQLVGIRKTGKGVGNDLAFTINREEFEVKVTSKGAKISKEIAVGRCPKNLRYAIRLKINAVESDPTYDDTATAYKTVLVPTGKTGKLTVQMRVYEHRKHGSTDKFITINFDFEWRRGNRRNILFAGEENLLDDDTDHSTPAQQEIKPCKREHSVSVVSTLWIAQMNIAEEMKAFKSAWLYAPNPDLSKYLNKKSTKKIALESFKTFAERTNSFFNDTGDPSEEDSYRIATVFRMGIEVEDGLITGFEPGSFRAKGGKEILNFEGSAHAKIVKEIVGKKSIVIRYIVYGKPSVHLEPGFQLAYPRVSRYIWHYIEVIVTVNQDCSINSRARFLTSSAYPSHRLWLNGKELLPASKNEFNNTQHDLIRLWHSTSMDTPPLDKLPELRKEFGEDTWPLFVVPRNNSGDVLPWP
ncbi:hypothetical protein [Kordia sp.]|uniref:hypothetical protein n=1 Tax=Kordia sp. TaxID=1965332 RepID=UPI003D2AB385